MKIMRKPRNKRKSWRSISGTDITVSYRP